tara:strand:- start:66 stop:344 length:279 start_codon:yes stop_codon:yes gene_type:complete
MDAILKEILDHPNPNEQHFREKYKSFFEKCPKLGEMVFSKNKEHQSMLRYMLTQKDKIKDEDSQYQASVNVGTMLRDTYITPLTNKMTPKKI